MKRKDYTEDSLVYRTEQYIIRRNNDSFDEIDKMSLRCRDLYNSVLFILRQQYFETEKGKAPTLRNYPSDFSLRTSFKDKDVFKKIGNAKVAQKIIGIAHNDFANYAKAYWAYIKNPSKFKAQPRLPKYKKYDKRCPIVFSNQAFSTSLYEKTGEIQPATLSIKLPFRHKDDKFTKIKEIRINPRLGFYEVIVQYEMTDQVPTTRTESAAIDLGVNNLATFVSSNGISEIYDGDKIKKINSKYNYLISKAKSELPKGVFTSKKIQNLWRRREAIIKHEMHKISKKIVEKMADNNIFELFVGKNKNWKQKVKLGKRNNRNFVSIPFNTFIFMLKYKAENQSIKVEEINESYTSKASSLDKDQLPDNFPSDFVFSGKRPRRGLYISADGTHLNADSNAAINILRKAVKSLNHLPNYEKWVKRLAISPKKILL